MLDLKAGVAEFIGCTIFLFVTIASASQALEIMGGGYLSIALVFGLTITVLAYSVGHYSGAQINCAVTFGLVLSRELEPAQAALNVLGQVAGSITGVALVALMTPCGQDNTGSLGANMINDAYSPGQAFLGELVGTFVLMYVVLETAVHHSSLSNRTLAPLAIGLAVFLAHSFLIKIDGCSINPTRSLGSAFVASIREDVCENIDSKDVWKHFYIFVLGPLAGAATAVATFKFMKVDHDPNEIEIENTLKTSEIALA